MTSHEPKPIEATAEHDKQTVHAEHGVQVRLLDALLKASQTETPKPEVEAVIEQLRQFCDVHFLSEELLMRNHAYPDYQAHVRAHANAMERLRDLDADASPETLGLLREMIVEHIRTFDRRLETYLETN